jgi:hypothetical protein
MDHFAGLDVSVKETSICIVDDTGKIVREVKVASAVAEETMSNRPFRLGLRHRALVINFLQSLTPLAFGLFVFVLIVLLILAYAGVPIV